MNRRAFIKGIGAAILGGAAEWSLGRPSDAAREAAAAQEGSSTMRTRKLGRTGHRSSLITFGGIVVAGMSDAEADRIVAEAIDSGVNEFDVAPSYQDAEVKLGHALPGKRDHIFLHCKTLERSKQGAARELRESLQRLRTDRVDLYQVHGLNDPKELEQVLAPGGAMEAFLEAREAGLIRFIGITGHRPSTLVEAMQRFPFDTVMAPVNFVLEHHSHFAEALLAEAGRRGIGVIAIKAMAARPRAANENREYPKCWYKPLDDDREADLALRFALSKRVATVIPPGDPRLLRKAVAFAQRYRRLEPAEAAELSGLAARLKPIFG